jgi:Peptidase family C25
MRKLALLLFLGALAALAFSLLPDNGMRKHQATLSEDVRSSRRPVFLAHDLTEAESICLTTSAVASNPEAVVLFDSPKLAPYMKAFLKAYQPSRIIPVGSFPEGRLELEQRLEIQTTPIVSLGADSSRALGQAFFPKATTVVACPPRPRGQLLQAACLAGVLKAPLHVVADGPESIEPLRRQLTDWGARNVYLVGAARELAGDLPNVTVVSLADEHAVAQAHVKVLLRCGPIETLVIANPFDDRGGRGGMAALAPLICLQKKAALLLTDDAGTNVPQVVEASARQPALRAADAVIFMADLKAIPVEQRPNPIAADKDPKIDMEPLTPSGNRLFTYAVGRLFHEDPGVVALLLARQRLLTSRMRGDVSPPSRRVLLASNTGGELPLLEVFSRNTEQEFRNAGYGVTALFGKDVSGPDLRQLMTEHNVFLWEGHHNALIKDWDFPSWDEPLPPSLVFLQSCLALKDYKINQLLSRGAVGVVGSSTRTYSASGGACSLAFFDALLYEDQTLGGSLRQAKNFLLAYALLKEKRLGKQATRTGANLRTAWAFSLWGDPTLRLPAPAAPPNKRPAIHHVVVGDTIVVTVPPEKHDKVLTRTNDLKRGYHVQMPPNARLAGLITKSATSGDEGQTLVPFVFAEVHLPNARPGQTPTLSPTHPSRLPSSHWVFCWDDRRRTGYLLVIPTPSQIPGELRFHVRWTDLPGYQDPNDNLAESPDQTPDPAAGDE